MKLFANISFGKFKGKKLLLPDLSTTRSTKSIARECVFNSLQNELKNSTFIECFGGSALMAASALSAYAKKAYVIELDKKAYDIAYKNAKSLDDEAIKVLQGDCFLLLPSLLEEKDIILYLDPPFDIRENFKDIYEKIYKFLEKIDTKNVKGFVLEHYSKHESPQRLKDFSRKKFKSFGKTSLSFYFKHTSF
ncbi:RsmD family RNA methyltransferase [Campylobacter avium]|uniref:RsmD family RNA methyltransferase n=1 Tax=Campylobacter avium TaxID=522485 RepID=UPI00255B9831|nr:RsmD family RNA methyltransferase [Campylobacter avium]